MAGGKIAHLSGAKSAFIEFFFKPFSFSAALFASAWLRWASPPLSYPAAGITGAADAAAIRVWGRNAWVMRWKMQVFSYPIAAFCEADNAYLVWFLQFCREIGKLAPEEIKERGD